MDYLQYYKYGRRTYKEVRVLNLVINGLPSIHRKEGNIDDKKN